MWYPMEAPSVFKLQMVLESVCWIGSGRFRTICTTIFAVVGLGSIEENDLLVETFVEVTNSVLNIRLLESVVLLRALLFVDGF